MQPTEIRKSMLILKSKPKSIASAENFLINREWRIFSTTSLKDALVYLGQNRPSFILISVDHPNKKILGLPKLLAQSFPVYSMVYTEVSSASAYKRLMEVDCPYRISPPTTGPGIERMINRILKEIEASGQVGNETIESVFAGPEKRVITEEASQIMPAEALERGRSPSVKEESLLQKGKGWTKEAPLWQPGTAPRDSAENESEATEDDLLAILAKGGPAGAPIAGSFQSTPAAKLQQVRGVSGQKVSGWHKSDSIVVRGTHEALDQSVREVKGGPAPVQKLKPTSQVACLNIESERFCGFLIAAMAGEKPFDEKFLKTVSEKLKKFLKDNGEKIAESETIELKIRPVAFEDWSMEYADFLRKSVHEGQEIAMAFFPTEKARNRLGESARQGMGSVDLAELKGDLEVDFNLYVYLPANDKYVLYTPWGGKFYDKQKGKLAEKGVTRMHVKKDDLMDVGKYRAQLYLNEKIEEFERKRAQITGAA